jgi:His/Glu/Gln/Arg/opine family amino acid ABC transporter permease subunit
VRLLAVGLVAVLTGSAWIGALPAAAEETGTGTNAEPPLRVALTGKYPPFSFYGEDGELTGFDVDVSRAVARRLGRDLEIVTTEWDGILAGLLAGKYDAIIGSMAVTPERAARVHFSPPYYTSGPQLFVHEEDREALGGIGDLAGRRVGVGLGETYEHYLRTHHPEVEVVTYKSTVDIFQDMLNRRLAAFFTDRLVGLHQVESAGMPFVPAGEPLYEERMAIPVRPGDPALAAAVDQAVTGLRRDGELAQLKRKWFGGEAAGEGAAVGAGEGAGAGETGAMGPAVIAGKLLRGFGVTLLVAVASIGLGLLTAIPFGVALHRREGLLYYPLRSINDFIRATPVLIQLFFVYFGAPQIGLTLSPLEAAILTLGVNASAYMAEVIRAGLMAVPPGQRLAARALGLSRWQIFRRVVWPQAFRIALPPLVSSVVALTKDTALISVISVGEVIREAQSIISVTYEPMLYYFLAAALFFVVTFPLMKLAGRLERRIAARGYGP